MLEPGLHDILADEYHDLPALSASGAWTIVQACPLKYWWNSPMNPVYTPKHNRAFDFGTAAHLAVLEPAQFAARTLIIDAPDYRTNLAKERRDAAYLAGKTPVLADQVDAVLRVRKAIHEHPVAGNAFCDGRAEQSFTWRDPETGLACKARGDWLRNGNRYIVDLKTSSSANPLSFPRTAFGLGYVLRAAWYIDGFELATGSRLEDYWFVVVEKEEPHLVSVFRYNERAIEWGRLMCRQALATLAQCIAKDECPGYRDPARPDRDAAFSLGIPTYAEYQLQERFEAGGFAAERPRPDLMRAAMQRFAPT